MNYADLNQFINEIDDLIKELIFSLSPLYKKGFSDTQRITVPLFTALHSTSESILILLQNQAVFDADILLRCLMEGTVKYCYLMNGTDNEREEKYREYSIILFEIDKLTDHNKAKEAIKVLKEFSQNNLTPFEAMILSDEEAASLTTKYPSSQRHRITQKWNYQSLLKDLARDHKEYEAQLGTLSTYATTSHFCHFDWTGVSARLEQIMNSPDESNVLFDYAHTLRILSNVISLYLFRVIEYMRGNQYSTRELTEICAHGFELASELDREQNQLLNQIGHQSD